MEKREGRGGEEMRGKERGETGRSGGREHTKQLKEANSKRSRTQNPVKTAKDSSQQHIKTLCGLIY